MSDNKNQGGQDNSGKGSNEQDAAKQETPTAVKEWEPKVGAPVAVHVLIAGPATKRCTGKIRKILKGGLLEVEVVLPNGTTDVRTVRPAGETRFGDGYESA